MNSEDLPVKQKHRIKSYNGAEPIVETWGCPVMSINQETEGVDSLRIFHVLDEHKSDEEESRDAQGSLESDISDNEIDAMLEDGIKEKVNEERAMKGFIERKAVTLEELGHSHFDVLPEGWIKIIHKSGMPLYLHSLTRVCTFARPYYLGQGSARRHQVPLSAIPCLQYKRALDDEKREKESQASSGNGQLPPLQTAKIETAKENKAGAFNIHQYCKSLFRFKTEQRLKFDSRSDRKLYAKAKLIEKQHHVPSLPDDIILVKCPIQNKDHPDARPKGEWIINPHGKTYTCILHEYVHQALKKPPTYEFRSLENRSTPFSATVMINGVKYGSGTGSNKKQAKLSAAKASLEILIPHMREKIRNDGKNGKWPDSGNQDDDERLSIFDAIKVEDPRVAEFCALTSEPSPYSILLNCLQRNFDSKPMPIDCKVNPNECIMTVGSYRAHVICKNKEDGKQRAAQAILQKMHPSISSWDSLLRLYGKCSMRKLEEQKLEEQEITMMLRSKASPNSPNHALLEKLRSEMLKLHERMSKKKPIGVFIPPSDVQLPSSSTQLNKPCCGRRAKLNYSKNDDDKAQAMAADTEEEQPGPSWAKRPRCY